MTYRPMLRTLTALSFGVGVSAASVAAAQDAGAPTPVTACDPSTLLCSMGLAGSRVESYDPLPVNIDSGWVPKCATGDHCDEQKIQIRAHISIEPFEGDVPIYEVDLTKSANMQVSWPDTDNFEVSLTPGSKTDATFKVTHGLVPWFELYMDLSGIGFGKQEIRLDATDLINLIPGAKFNYLATKSTTFLPWGFQSAGLNVVGTDLNNSQLFAVTFKQLENLLGAQGLTGVADGSFSFNATTDLEFTYQTTEVSAVGGTGPITSPDGTTLFPISDGDYLEYTAVTKGIIQYSGTLDMKPVIHITKIAGLSINLDFPINVGLSFPIQGTDVPVTFPAKTVHMPLPNVFVPSSFIDFGTVQTGGRTEKAVTIENTGEMGAMLEFESSDPQFSPTVVSTQLGSASTYELRLRFSPSKAGQQKATITVRSNDPDSPEQSFEVFGYGEGQDLPDAGSGGGGSGGAGATGGSGGNPAVPPSGGGSAEDDGGCGCRVPAGSSSGGLAALLLGLAGLGLRRRRG